MNVSETLRGLWRRWYITIPGLILAVALAVGSFIVIKPGYERTATQLLLPGDGLVPEGTTNPYLFLGGLSQAADILTRTVGAGETLGPIAEKFPGLQVEVKRDPLSSGPVILFTVTAKSDADAAAALDDVLAASVETLDRLQTQQGVASRDRISISPLTKDAASTPQQRTRMTVAAGVGLGIAALTLLIASMVDGLVRRRRHRAGATADGERETGDRSEDGPRAEARVSEKRGGISSAAGDVADTDAGTERDADLAPVTASQREWPGGSVTGLTSREGRRTADGG